MMMLSILLLYAFVIQLVIALSMVGVGARSSPSFRGSSRHHVVEEGNNNLRRVLQTTAKPTTGIPTSRRPTAKPSRRPTSRPRTRLPTSRRPTSAKPSRRPTSRPSTRLPTSRRPTSSRPTTKKTTTRTPTSTVSTKPTSSPTTTKVPTLIAVPSPSTVASSTSPPSSQPTTAPSSKPSFAPSSQPATFVPTTPKPSTASPTTLRPSSKATSTASPTLMPIAGPRNATGGSMRVGWTSGLTTEAYSGGGDTFIITGPTSGDIQSTSDRFHYLYFNATGDVAVTCLIKSLNGTQIWRKGGIMFRKNLGPRSANIMISTTGSGFTHQYRLMEGNNTVPWNDQNYQTSNVWLRLVKKGNTITSYVKKDGDLAFVRYQTTEVDLGTEFHVGLAVSSINDVNGATLQVQNFEIVNDSRGGGIMMDVIGTSDTVPPRMLEVKNQDIIWAKVPAGMFSINSTGTGIGGTADNFGFVQQEVTGNVTATLHLEKVFRRNRHTKGGLMIRSSHAVDAAHVSLLVDVDRGVSLVYRTANGGPTESKCVGVWSEDVDFNLIKTDKSVRCQYKQSGMSEWTDLGSITADFGTSFLVGQAMASGESGQLSQLMSSGVVVQRRGLIPDGIIPTESKFYRSR